MSIENKPSKAQSTLSKDKLPEVSDSENPAVAEIKSNPGNTVLATTQEMAPSEKRVSAEGPGQIADKNNQGATYDDVVGLAQTVMLRIAEVLKDELGLEFSPVTRGSDDPEILVTGFRANEDGTSRLSILAQQDIYDYAGDPVITPDNQHVERMTAKAELEISSAGKVEIGQMKRIGDDRFDPETLFHLTPSTCLDAGSTALSRAADRVQANMNLTEEPTFAGRDDPEMKIVGFAISSKTRNPVVKMMATQPAYDYAGDPLEDGDGNRYDSGLPVTVVFDVEAKASGFAVSNIQIQ
jgi:hypothetical protein